MTITLSLLIDIFEIKSTRQLIAAGEKILLKLSVLMALDYVTR